MLGEDASGKGGNNRNNGHDKEKRTRKLGMCPGQRFSEEHGI